MGNSLQKNNNDIIDIHKSIIDISKRLLLDHDKFLKDEICLKILKDGIKQLNNNTNENIFLLFQKIYLPKNKSKIIIKNNKIEFTTRDLININEQNIKLIQNGGNKYEDELFFEKIKDFRKKFITTIDNINKNKNNKIDDNINKINNNIDNIINNLEETKQIEESSNRFTNKFKNKKNYYNFSKKIIINNKKKKQILTKQQVCSLIIEHYVFRIKLIALILKNYNKKENLCYKYYKSLTEGKYCIPDIKLEDIKNVNNLNTKKFVKKIFKDLEKFSKNLNNCEKVGGITYIADEELINDLIKKKKGYFKVYKDNLNKLNKLYIKSLKKIEKILKNIKKNKLITNYELNKYANEFINITKNLNINCKTYYLTSIIAFLHIKLKLRYR